jgi:hypothetical protein
MLSARLKDFGEHRFRWPPDSDHDRPGMGPGMDWGSAPAVGSGV